MVWERHALSLPKGAKMSRNLEAYPEILEDLWSKLTDLLLTLGMAADQADEAAFSVTEYIRSNWSGRMFYVRKIRQKAQADQDFKQVPLLELPTTHAQEVGDAFGALQQYSANLLNNQELAVAVVGLVREEWSGQNHYVPKGKAFDYNRRDYQIWREFRGSNNVGELMRKYGLTEQRLYQINARVQKAHDRRTQPGLPLVA